MQQWSLRVGDGNMARLHKITQSGSGDARSPERELKEIPAQSRFFAASRFHWQTGWCESGGSLFKESGRLKSLSSVSSSLLSAKLWVCTAGSMSQCQPSMSPGFQIALAGNTQSGNTFPYLEIFTYANLTEALVLRLWFRCLIATIFR